MEVHCGAARCRSSGHLNVGLSHDLFPMKAFNEIVLARARAVHTGVDTGGSRDTGRQTQGHRDILHAIRPDPASAHQPYSSVSAPLPRIASFASC